MKSRIFFLFVGAGLVCQVGFASVIESDSVTNTGFVVPGLNLLQSAVVSINNASYIQPEGGASGGLGILTNLSFGNPSGDASQTTPIHSGAVITYTFSSPATIASLNTYTAWTDSGRGNQDYTVEYALAGNPSLFLPLASVAYHPSFGSGTVNTYVSLTSSSGPLLSNVVAIQFSFPSAQNGFVGYRELNATAPEPCTLALFGLGTAVLLASPLLHVRSRTSSQSQSG